MSKKTVSHQGMLRGCVELPIEQEATSDSDIAPTTAQKKQHDDDLEIEELPDDHSEPQYGQDHDDVPKTTPKDSPAYFAPIDSIPKIGHVEPVSSNAHPTPPPDNSPGDAEKRPIHQIPKDHLIGKPIGEFGDILGDDGAVLGRVEGDLPSMFGRTISNARGDVIGDAGELLGYVAEVSTGEGQQKSSEAQVPTWSLTEVMKAMAAAGKGPGGLRVDPFGNILDAGGDVVGSFHDNISGFGKKNAGAGVSGGNGDSGGSKSSAQAQESHGTSGDKDEEQAGSPSQAQQHENAQSHRKEDKKESPSDIFLDVKSTTEGIQLTIRIPTVFNSGEQGPKLVFGGKNNMEGSQ